MSIWSWNSLHFQYFLFPALKNRFFIILRRGSLQIVQNLHKCKMAKGEPFTRAPDQFLGHKWYSPQGSSYWPVSLTHATSNTIQPTKIYSSNRHGALQWLHRIKDADKKKACWLQKPAAFVFKCVKDAAKPSNILMNCHAFTPTKWLPLKVTRLLNIALSWNSIGSNNNPELPNSH